MCLVHITESASNVNHFCSKKFLTRRIGVKMKPLMTKNIRISIGTGHRSGWHLVKALKFFLLRGGEIPPVNPHQKPYTVYHEDAQGMLDQFSHVSFNFVLILLHFSKYSESHFFCPLVHLSEILSLRLSRFSASARNRSLEGATALLHFSRHEQNTFLEPAKIRIVAIHT